MSRRWHRLPPRAGAQVISTQMADGYDPPSAALWPRAPILGSPSRRLLATNPIVAVVHGITHGSPQPIDVPRPARHRSRWQQWKRERACRRDTRHCYHPADVMIEWFCCMCSADIDGMPDQRCVFCKAATT